MYKAKYYADMDFMEVKLGSNPSFIWRSVLKARRVICACSNWRIGNGKDIQILNQPWLNSTENPYVTTIAPTLINQNVASLYRTDTKEWDLDIIIDIFEDRDQ